MAVEIVLTGDAFRTKVRQALDAWVRIQPQAAKAFIRSCKQRRDAGNCDPDMEQSAMVPNWPVEALRATEFASQMMYGVPCGTGDRAWDIRNDLMDIFMSEMPESQISQKTGAPKRRA